VVTTRAVWSPLDRVDPCAGYPELDNELAANAVSVVSVTKQWHSAMRKVTDGELDPACRGSRTYGVDRRTLSGTGYAKGTSSPSCLEELLVLGYCNGTSACREMLRPAPRWPHPTLASSCRAAPPPGWLNG